MNKRAVGTIEKYVIDALGLNIKENTPIFIADTNIQHIREHHSDAYMKYMDSLESVIAKPDYIGIAGVYAPSIEYVKHFRVNDELVNVAVRATSRGVHYVRSMFIIEEGRLNDYLKKNKLIKIDN